MNPYTWTRRLFRIVRNYESDLRKMHKLIAQVERVARSKADPIPRIKDFHDPDDVAEDILNQIYGAKRREEVR